MNTHDEDLIDTLSKWHLAYRNQINTQPASTERKQPTVQFLPKQNRVNINNEAFDVDVNLEFLMHGKRMVVFHKTINLRQHVNGALDVYNDIPCVLWAVIGHEESTFIMEAAASLCRNIIIVEEFVDPLPIRDIMNRVRKNVTNETPEFTNILNSFLTDAQNINDAPISGARITIPKNISRSEQLTRLFQIAQGFKTYAPEYVPLLTTSLQPYIMFNMVEILLFGAAMLSSDHIYDVTAATYHTYFSIIIDFLMDRWLMEVIVNKKHPQLANKVKYYTTKYQLNRLTTHDSIMKTTPGDKQKLDELSNEIEQSGIALYPFILTYNFSTIERLKFFYHVLQRGDSYCDKKKTEKFFVLPTFEVFIESLKSVTSKMTVAGMYDREAVMLFLQSLTKENVDDDEPIARKRRREN